MQMESDPFSPSPRERTPITDHEERGQPADHEQRANELREAPEHVVHQPAGLVYRAPDDAVHRRHGPDPLSANRLENDGSLGTHHLEDEGTLGLEHPNGCLALAI